MNIRSDGADRWHCGGRNVDERVQAPGLTGPAPERGWQVQRVADGGAKQDSRIALRLDGGWVAVGWQVVIWAAGAATVTAVLTVGWPLMTSARTVDPRRRSATIAASTVIVTTVIGVAVNSLVGLPAGVRAAWALSTACAACWLAVRARGLSTDAFATGGRAPAPDTNSDALSAQDDVVQALVVASYALQMGDNSRASAAVDGALRRSRARLDALLHEGDPRCDLVRREPTHYRAVGDASPVRH